MRACVKAGVCVVVTARVPEISERRRNSLLPRLNSTKSAPEMGHSSTALLSNVLTAGDLVLSTLTPPNAPPRPYPSFKHTASKSQKDV